MSRHLSTAESLLSHPAKKLKSFLLDDRLNLIFTHNQSGILIIDEQGIIVSFNPAAERISKLKRDKVIGRHLSEVNLPVGLLDVLKTGQTDISRRHQYNHVTFIANRSPIVEDGKIIGAISIFQDISESIYLSEELRQSKEAYEQLQTILEASYDGFLITDVKGVVLQHNTAFERLMGMPSGMIKGRRVSHWVKNKIIKQDLTKIVAEKRLSATIVEKTPKGKKLMLTGSPVFNQNNEIIKIVINVRDISELTELRKELKETKKLAKRFSNHNNIGEINHTKIITNSPKMKELLDLSWRVAQVDSTILIRGESGVGKELFAEFIYQNSKRYNEPYIRVNCGAIPEHLLESELFGYECGAFTGAKKGGKPGLFELANKGTIFLDEIGELPVGLQVKLLRVLQEQEINRIGSLEPQKIDVRVIAATNRDLSKLIQEKGFREDLFFRLNVIPIEVPPLRERKEDIIPLIYSFMESFSEKYNIKRVLSPQTISLLVDYDWPGNVRELSNVIERILVISSEELIKPSLLPEHIQKAPITIQYNKASPMKLRDLVDSFEKSIIRQAIQEHGTTHQAAKALGINPSTLFRKLKS